MPNRELRAKVAALHLDHAPSTYREALNVVLALLDAKEAEPAPFSEITELDLQNAGSQQTVEQLTRVFDEIDRTGQWSGRFGSEQMSALVDRYRDKQAEPAPRAQAHGNCQCGYPAERHRSFSRKCNGYEPTPGAEKEPT